MPGVESIWILKYLDIENLLRGEGGELFMSRFHLHAKGVSRASSETEHISVHCQKLRSHE